MSFLTYTSIWPYFVLMACFAGFASLIDFEKKSTETVTPHGRRFNVPLESLRGILALSVFFHHSLINYYFFKTGKWAPIDSPFYYLMGSAAVLMFFYLSGYLFWTKCLTQNGIKNLRSFFIARARRLLPAYWSVLALVLLIVCVVTGFTLQESFPKVVKEVAQWVFVGLPMGQYPIVNAYANTNFINAGVAWSLRYEIFFYLSLPLMALLSRGHWTLFWVVAFGFLYAVMFDVTRAPDYARTQLKDLIFDISQFYFLGFCMGMLTAYMKLTLPSKWVELLRSKILGLLIIGLMFLQFFMQPSVNSIQQSLYLIVPFILIAFGNDFFGILSKRPFLFLGKISYSVYLVHGVVIFVLSRLVDHWVRFESLEPPIFWAFTLVAGCIAIAMSTAMYRWIELPWQLNTKV